MVKDLVVPESVEGELVQIDENMTMGKESRCSRRKWI